MENFTITPKVDASREFIEIAMDFANPLDLVREAISNAFDAGANKYHALMKEPNKKLHNHTIPEVEVTSEPAPEEPGGTVINILGYNNNRRDKFSHEQLKDYILWFTKFGSVEREFGIDKNLGVKLELKGLKQLNDSAPRLFCAERKLYRSRAVWYMTLQRFYSDSKKKRMGQHERFRVHQISYVHKLPIFEADGKSRFGGLV